MDVMKYVLSPMLFLQERKIRKDLVPLKAPVGPTSGVQGQGQVLRVMLIGDSTAAGVGAQTFEQAIISQFLKHFKGYEVEWHLIAQSGNDSKMVLEQMLRSKAKNIDILITCMGVNDVTGSISPKEWIQLQKRIWKHATENLGVKYRVISGMLPIWNFPGLPQPLKWYLSNRAKQFDKVLRRQMTQEEQAYYLPMEFTLQVEHLAEDGYHPGPEIYKMWGLKCAKIVKKFLNASPVAQPQEEEAEIKSVKLR